MFGLMAVLLIIATCAHSDGWRTLAAVILFLLTLLMIIGLGECYQ